MILCSLYSFLYLLNKLSAKDRYWFPIDKNSSFDAWPGDVILKKKLKKNNLISFYNQTITAFYHKMTQDLSVQILRFPITWCRKIRILILFLAILDMYLRYLTSFSDYQIKKITYIVKQILRFPNDLMSRGLVTNKFSRYTRSLPIRP